MSSLVAYYAAAYAVIIAFSIIFQVNGQPTVEVSENGDSSNIVVEEIHQLRVELLGQLNKAVLSMKEFINASSQPNLLRTQQDIHVDNHRSQEQVQSIHEVLNGSFLQIKTILQAVGRCSQEQDVYIKRIQNVYELFNASFQELKSQQDTVVTSIQAADRRFQEQNIKQLQSIHELLNTSYQQMNNINASFQLIKNQQDTIVTSHQALHRGSQEQDICIKRIQSVHELFNTSFQELKNEQNTVVTSIQAVDRRSKEQDTKQIQSIHELLNTSFQQMNNINASFELMKNQQETIVTSLQAVHRSSQEQDICIKRIQSVHELVNTSFQELKNQQDTVVTSIQAVDRRSQEQNIYIKQIQSIHRLLNETILHDISIRNKTQIFWKRETAFATDVGEVPIFVSLANDWIVLMYRFDGSLDFFRNWTEYKTGFGDMRRGEFWLGIEKIHRLTKTHGVAYTLHIDIQLNANGQWYYADYDTFSIDSESNKYILHLSGFSGNAGDSLTELPRSSTAFLDGMNFSTFDNDNDNYVNFNCALSAEGGGGWWFNQCQRACLTCFYNSYAFRWNSLWHLSSDYYGKLRAARMMIKSK